MRPKRKGYNCMFGGRILTAAFLLVNSYLAALAQDVKIVYNNNGADVQIAHKDSITAKVKGGDVELTSYYAQYEMTVLMSGECSDGRLVLKSEGKVKIQLKNLKLTSNEGAALWLKNKKRIVVEAMKGTENYLGVTACKDTAVNKATVVWAKEKLMFAGKGSLTLEATGDGCKGINCKDDIVIDDLTLSVVTKGDNLGRDERGFGGFGFGGPGGFEGMEFPEMPEGMGFPPMPEGMDFSQMFPDGFPGMPEGMEFPPMPEGMEFHGGMGFPGGGMGFPGGMGPQDAPGGMGFDMRSGDPDETIQSAFKQRYISTTKAIKAYGTVTINSGTVYCKTSSAGAEGIEGKKGVTINGGTVTIDAVDDAINANGKIVFNGGKTIAESHCNDAIDANVELGFAFNLLGQPANASEASSSAIIINGGEVYGWSHVGMPEEGMDCDFAALEIAGGTAFSIGAGMGEMPSVPTQQSAKQPTILFIGLNLTKGEKIELKDGKKTIYSLVAPFSFNNSASIVTCPKLKTGKNYTLVTKGQEIKFALKENFTTVRANRQ